MLGMVFCLVARSLCSRMGLPRTIIQSILCFAFVSHFSSAAHSRRRVIVRSAPEVHYDRSITTFDPSGLLLQVEYGLEASLRGESVVAVLQDDGSILVLLSRPTNSVSTSSKVHRIDEHLWLFTAGLSGDARFLASYIRSAARQHRLSFGEPMTVQELARSVADVQHELTQKAGARPLGCTAIVVGTDPAYKVAGACRLFRSNPGGILEDCLYCCAGQDQERLMSKLQESYDTIRKSETRDAIQELLSVRESSTENKEASGFDLWFFRPNAERRGKTQATCFLDVGSPESLDKIGSYLTNA